MKKTINFATTSVSMHKKYKGKIAICPKVKVNTLNDLSIYYTPGVAAPCLEIQKNINNSFIYTNRANQIAVITDGSAILGLGNIGPEAGMPVMEGKALLFKEFADIDAYPLCIKTNNVDEFVNTVKLLEGNFAGINLEDISAPRCFEIEEKLKQVCSIPVFHDDQHGTAIVVCAALLNALKVVKKEIGTVTIVINGAGAAGIAVAKLILHIGIGNVIVCDRNGILNKNDASLKPHHLAIAKITNNFNITGSLSDALNNADCFIGVSAGNILNEQMLKSMNKNAIIFAMANPIPEVMPDIAKKAGIKIIGTGRSDFPNQINNVLAFPGVFRGALNVKAKQITKEMKIAAVYALATYIKPNKLDVNNVLPSALDKNVAKVIARAVAKAYISK
jgi:malate dehydrogenase (oxaloacetate-decarboxylating)